MTLKYYRICVIVFGSETCASCRHVRWRLLYYANVLVDILERDSRQAYYDGGRLVWI